MTNRLVMIEAAPAPDHSRSLPIYVDEYGAVQQQGFWKGDPVTVIGFAERFDAGRVTLRFEDFWAEPSRAVGTYLVLVDDKGQVSAHLSVVERAVEVVGDDGSSAKTGIGESR